MPNINTDPYTQPRRWPWPLTVARIVASAVAAAAVGVYIVATGLPLLHHVDPHAPSLDTAGWWLVGVAAVVIAAAAAGPAIRGAYRDRATTMRVWMERCDADTGEWRELTAYRWQLWGVALSHDTPSGTALSARASAAALAAGYLQTQLDECYPDNGLVLPFEEVYSLAERVRDTRIVTLTPDPAHRMGRPTQQVFALADFLPHRSLSASAITMWHTEIDHVIDHPDQALTIDDTHDDGQ